VSGATRDQALRRARQALAELRIEGIPTVVDLHRRLLTDPAFTGPGGLRVHTRWLETECQWLDQLAGKRPLPPDGSDVVRTWVEVDGRRMSLALPAGFVPAFRAGPADEPPAPPPDPAVLTALLSGVLVAWHVSDGEQVTQGQSLGVLEAMKMEKVINAHRSGTVRCLAKPGEFVAEGTELARIE